jgi:hypothetical protein
MRPDDEKPSLIGGERRQQIAKVGDHVLTA